MQAVSPVASHPFANADTCKAWFRSLSVSDTRTAVDIVGSALARMPTTAFSGAAAVGVLQALETLRRPIHALVIDLSSRYADKAVPLSDTQRAAFESNITLAYSLAYVYYSMIRDALAPASLLHERAALIHQRALFWTAQGMIEHLRGRQRFADKDWDLAQEVLQSADRHQLMDASLRDSLQPQNVSSVAATYARMLLLHLAGARSLGAREIDWTAEYAHYFENKGELTYVLADSQGVLAGMPGPAPSEQVKSVKAGGLMHYLHVGSLSKSINRRIDAMNHGQLVETPKLSGTPSLTSQKSLLPKLHRAWCARANQRQFPRRRTDDAVYCAFDAPAVYALMKRRPYVAPPPPKLYDHTEVANIFLDRDAASSTNARRNVAQHSSESWATARAQLELWQSQEESANGMSLLRTRGGARVRQGQLIALRLGDAGVAMIGVVRWAEQAASAAADASGEPGVDPGHTVEIGVQLLPGLARAGAVRYIGASAVAQASGKAGSSAALILDHFSRGAARDGAAGNDTSGPNTIMPGQVPERSLAGEELPEIEVAEHAAAVDSGKPYRYSERATIVLPAGFSREGDVVEFIDGGNSFKLRLGKQTHRHGDFDRLHFAMIE
ncbi:MAG TPA: hypothetical protein VH105_17930 [Burkholderiales bacterium]|nr:hypothetical protein [Burkholderiales bacterium]